MPADVAIEPELRICAESPPDHAGAIEALFNRTFGPGHFAKTAERLREFSVSLPDLNRVAVWQGEVVAVCRVWPIFIGDSHGLFFGPVAVDPAFRGAKLGWDVTAAALEAAAAEQWPWGLLIGAPDYFGALGFEPVPEGDLFFPGPQDPARVMLRSFASHVRPSGRVRG